jgi:YbbR domain-containing protein
LDLLRSAGAVTVAVVRQVAGSFRDNWGIAVLALAVAVALWVYVSDEDEAERTARIPGSIAVTCVNIPAGQVPSPPCEEQSVNVSVRANESDLDDLTTSDFTATVDLSAVTTTTANVPVNVEPATAGIEVVQVSPPQIRVSLEDLTTRTVPIRARGVGVPPRGFEAQSFSVEPEAALISGPASLVSRVDAVEADVDLSSARTNFEQRVLLRARDQQGGELQNIDVQPQDARVQVTMVQLEFSAPFVVQPTISGSPAAGFAAVGIQINPAFVLITGPPEIFQTLDPVRGVPTEPISIDGASADVVRTVALRLPDGARVEQPGVTVRVLVGPLTAGSSTSTSP